MNKAKDITNEPFKPNKLFLDSPSYTRYLWKNLIIEKRISVNWVDKLFKGSIVDSFWTVLSSPVS